MKIKEDLMKLTTSQRNLAKVLQVTQPRVSQLVREGVVIRDDGDDSGGVFIVESLRNFYQREKATSDDEVDINREKALHERAKRLISELKLEKARGNLYDSKVVERVIIADLVKLRTRLLTIPSKLAPTLEGKSKGEIDVLLTREIEESLADLSQFDPSLFVSDDIDDDEDETT